MGLTLHPNSLVGFGVRPAPPPPGAPASRAPEILPYVQTHLCTGGHWPLRPRQRARCLWHRARRKAVGRGEPRRRREGPRRAREPRAPRRRGCRSEYRRRRRDPAADARRVHQGRGWGRAAAAGPLRRRRLLPAERSRAATRARAADRGDDRGRGPARAVVARRAGRRAPRRRHRTAVGAVHPPGADRGLGGDRRTRTRSSASCT